MSSVDCLFCDHRNPVGSKFCNACGDALHLQPCEACGAVDGRQATHCYRCGQPFGSKSIPKAANASMQRADFWRNPRSKAAGGGAAGDGVAGDEAAAASPAAQSRPGTADPVAATAAAVAAAPAAPEAATGTAPRRRLSPLLVAGLIGLAGLGSYAFHRQTTAQTPPAPGVRPAPGTASMPAAQRARPVRLAAPAAPPAAPVPSSARNLPTAPTAPASPDDPDVAAPMPFGAVLGAAAWPPFTETVASERGARPTPSDPPVAATRSVASSASRGRLAAARPARNAPQRLQHAAMPHRAAIPADGIPPQTPAESRVEPVRHETPPVRAPQPSLEAERAIPWVPPSLYQG